MSVNCPACGVLNDREAAFCGGCGVALGLICPSCGAGPLPAGVAFCTACGSELARPGVLLERKIVSVVFVDLVGFTAMSEVLDPEVVVPEVVVPDAVVPVVPVPEVVVALAVVAPPSCGHSQFPNAALQLA